MCMTTLSRANKCDNASNNTTARERNTRSEGHIEEEASANGIKNDGHDDNNAIANIRAPKTTLWQTLTKNYGKSPFLMGKSTISTGPFPVRKLFLFHRSGAFPRWQRDQRTSKAFLSVVSRRNCVFDERLSSKMGGKPPNSDADLPMVRQLDHVRPPFSWGTQGLKVSKVGFWRSSRGS